MRLSFSLLVLVLLASPAGCNSSTDGEERAPAAGGATGGAVQATGGAPSSGGGPTGNPGCTPDQVCRGVYCEVRFVGDSATPEYRLVDSHSFEGCCLGFVIETCAHGCADGACLAAGGAPGQGGSAGERGAGED